ncbi:DUF1152 domain-containing protein [Dactylosporangium aurantiacum]|uniref:DUF1152 domain-containing protein n=1 Tax=Dactylosporangium aurantiacum TaxID=35754 RepID=A0A9Q9IPB8_9ACTN|nr:DUF1152 domain-containing protein [Dactylosporangium aurantiacum]MDG6103048.1 DUF1152 domain-containing protein [Dactylosporangium aurantiacum]UWZ57560.1 DUF1152 domain-containing protein [Dactylosporangium aurantiacum]
MTWRLPFFEALGDARRVLVAGAGGGYDVYAGLPLALSLMHEGRTVHLGSLSIANLYESDAWLEPGIAAVTPDTVAPGDPFAERSLARWLALHRLPPTVYAFPRTGVRPLRSAYRRLAKRLDLDAIILVDGGTDILMRGDEAALGTPVEDATSLAAVNATPVAVKLVASIGFGVDAYHGINHVQVLENIAALDRAGAYLGAFTVPSHGPEAALYRDAVEHARAAAPQRASIVNGQIAAALTGAAGDVPLDGRTGGPPLFVNPLMAMYFTFDLAGLAARSLYLDRIRGTDDMLQVSHIIERFRDGITPRPRMPFPH